MSDVRPLVAGNWKMNGLVSALDEARKIEDGVRDRAPQVDVMLCPPATMIAGMAAMARDHLQVGAQDCHENTSGAHTGDLAAEMLVDAGATAIIVGHSERRADHGELSSDVAAKAAAAHRAGAMAIICVGETAGERASGLTLKVIERQLKGSLPSGATAANTIVAYEPVWAIGTGLTPTADDVANVHAFIRGFVSDHVSDGAAVRLLYGGSVKASNAVELMAVANVNGALVGGASLKADDFLGIVEVYA